jgi:hypothetical protein
MKQFWIRVSAILFGLTCMAAYAAPLPLEIDGGADGFITSIKSKLGPASVMFERNRFDSNSELVSVYHSVGSGVPLLDVYVYGCGKVQGVCQQVAVRRRVPFDGVAKRPITTSFNSKTGELKVSLSNGKVALLTTITK